MKAITRQTRLIASDREGIADASACLRAGGLVALPTETVYGLGADATDGRAVAGIYAAKGRPSFNPLIAHLATIDAARAQGLFDAQALALAKAFWPGPLTLVVPVSGRTTVCDLARAGLESVALRVPDHPVALALLEAVGRPIAAPSANLSGHVSPTTASHVLADLDGRIDLILDAGPTGIGVESTIVACLGGVPRLLRPGGLERARIEAVIGCPLVLDLEGGVSPRAPGQLASHYAPRARLFMNAARPAAGQAWLGFGPLPAQAKQARQAETLSATSDLLEAAANLFAALRRLDASGAADIHVAPVPMQGLGEAINDRLQRASAAR
ncbi:MAG: L-threonylcarbamoyladenylate synthase [Bosea sp. (in: a-proteobacteria)]